MLQYAVYLTEHHSFSNAAFTQMLNRNLIEARLLIRKSPASLMTHKP